MIWLHDFDIIHRDLKAANVLVREVGGEFNCVVADYECSIGTMGTNFHRPPEILRAIKERLKHSEREKLFTTKADVYSYGMTCYEILTRKLPFEHVPPYKYDHVLDGNLPEVPTYVHAWARELLKGCWEFNPAARPSFEEILNLLSRISDHERTVVWTQLVTELLSMYKSHWSIASDTSYDDELFVEEGNKELFKELQKHATWGVFFLPFKEDELLLGEKFGEGAQAEIFHAQINWQSQFHPEVVPEILQSYEIALKVFKKGTLLRHLQSQWPLEMLKYGAERIRSAKTGTSLGTSMEWEDPMHIRNPLGGTLLSDGRFAFVMRKEQQDLRSLINRKMLWRAAQDCGPFSEEIAEKIMHDVAHGIDWLHTHNIIHRDLKSSNVLVGDSSDANIQCFVMDYECSIGVVGTGFFRAPEILQAIKDKNLPRKLEIFSRASDVYSYGMTCYEILTGKLPFEEQENIKYAYDLVLSGGRPKVPKYVHFWAHGLLRACWEPNPEDRPSIRDILDEFALRRRGYVPPAGL